MFKKLYRKFFYVPKYAKMTDKVFKLRISLYVLMAIMNCAIFCSTTFAWFNSQQSSIVNPIVAAEYFLKVEIDNKVLDTNEYICPLTVGDCHVFMISAEGTATTGYCEIKADGQTYTTVPISKNQNITLNVIARQGTEISFSSQWGVYSGNEQCYGDGNSIVISETPYQVYVVEENVTLEQIAAYYNVSGADILLYNGISEIIVGEELKIPNTDIVE